MDEMKQQAPASVAAWEAANTLPKLTLSGSGDPNELLGFETSIEIRDGTPVPVITLIPRWFAEKRRRAAIRQIG